MRTAGGLIEKFARVAKSQNPDELVDIFKDVVLRAYGEKSADGRRFIKNDEVKEAFMQTEAYSELFMELATNAEAAAAFFNGIIPQEPTVKE